MPITLPEGVRRAVSDDFDEREERRYRKDSNAKLKQLQDTPMAKLSEDEPLNISTERPKWMGSRGYDTPDYTSTAEPTIVPEESDPARDYGDLGPAPSFAEELSRPAESEDGSREISFGAGGPEGPPLDESLIIDIRKRLADKQGAVTADKDMRSRLLQGVNPDEAASAIELAEKSGVNRLQVEVNPDTYKRADTMRQIDELRTSAPKLRAWLDYNPENLDVAHDDTDNLGWWEQAQKTLGEVGGGIGGALASGYLKISEGTYGVARAGFELNDQLVSTVTGKPQISEPSKFFAGLQEEAKSQSDSFMPEVDDPTARGVLSGFQSLPPSVMAAVMGIMSGGAAPALGAMGGITGGSEYGRARSQGMSPTAAAGYGTGQGLIEAGTEALPMGWLLGDVAKRTPFFEMLAKQALGEGVTEQAATHSQDFLSWAVLPENADKPIATYLEERGPAAYETLIATLVGTGVQTTVAKSVDMTLQAASEGAQARRTDQLAKTFEAMSAGAAASKLLKRLPQKYRDVVANVTKDGPLESVRVQPEAFEELAQSAGVSTEQLAQAFRIDPADINSALTSGEDVVIPSGNYAAALQTAKKEIGVSGETIHAAFAPNMRLRAEDFTAKEREAMKAVYEEERAATEQANSDTTFADAADRVREAVRTQLADAKIFNNETASTQAQIASEMIITLAERTDQDPEALWNEVGFKVTAQVGEDVSELSQSQTRPAEPVSDEELTRASEALQPREFEAWKLGRDGRSAEDIAVAIGGENADVSPQTVLAWQTAARRKGFALARLHEPTNPKGRPQTPETQRVIEMLAAGKSRDEIVSEVYPGRDAAKAKNLIRQLAHKHKAAIEAKRQPVEELAQSSLDMSEAATAQRAQEQGFDTSKVLYHGTANGGFDRFDPYGRSNHGLFGQGIYLTDSPEVASTYTNKGAAKMERQGREPRQAVYPVYARLKNPIDMDAAADIEAWRAALGQYSDIGLEPEMTNEQVYRNLEEALEQEELPKWEGAEIAQDILRNMGHDGIVHVGGGRVDAEGVKHGVTIVFDPENVRGKFAAFDPANTASDDLLAQDKRGGFTGINLSQDPVIRLYASANLSTFSHEAAHWYLTTLEKLARAEAPHPFVVAQLAAVREWAGKSAEFQIYDETGQITPEGVELQEAFSESFEAYLREGKAPSTALRQVFATMKAWLLRVYKSIRNIGSRVNLNEEIKDVFDRMLATEEAIAAARTGMEQDADRMAKALLDKGVITEKAYARTRERLQAAREKAEADLMARLMEEYERSQKSWYRDEERQVRRDVTSEIDERPEQRAFAWLSGKGWRDTQADHVERAAEAEFMQAVDEGLFETDANDDTLKLLQQRAIERGLGPLILMFRTTSGRIIAFPGENGAVYHDLARNLFGLGELKLEHGMYNPRKWPTLAEMDAAGDRAWYATTGEHADTEVRELAQRTYQQDKHREQVKTAYDYLRDNPEAVSGPLSKIMAAVDVSAYAADRARRLIRRGELAQLDGAVIVYRGSEENGISSAGVGRLGSGVYLAEDPEIGGEWGGQTGKVDAYRINGRLFDLDETTAEGLENYEKQEDTAAAKKLFARLKSEGYVGVRDPWSGHINVFVDGAMERYANADVELGATWTNEEPELGQSIGPTRQLDAMGFYSAAQEAARRVPDNIWNMGWQAARNALAKGRDGIAPKRTEIEYLGLDAMFGDTKLKGDELKSLVLEHIAAKRLSLVENFARFDPSDTRVPSKRSMLAAMSPQALSSLINVDFQNGGNGRSEIVSDLGNPLYLYIQRKGEPLASPTYYDLMQPQSGGKAKVIATGTTGDLDPIIGKMIFDANPERAARRIDKDALAEAYREGYASNLVRGAGDVRLPGEDVPLFEAVIGLPEGVPGSDYLAPISHVGGKAKGTLVTAHGEERTDDKGQRTVFVGQVQSDMAQRAREVKQAEVGNKDVIDRANINDRSSAIDYLFSLALNYTRQQIEVDNTYLSDAKVIDDARTRWAYHNNGQYSPRSDFDTHLDAPLLSTSEWTNVAVRSMLYRAAREGFQSISFPTAETSEIIQGNDDAAQHYETNVKGALEKLVRQLGGEVRKGGVNSGEPNEGKIYRVIGADGRRRGGFNNKVYAEEFRDQEPGSTIEIIPEGTQNVASAYVLDITPEMRAKIVSEGFPLFQSGADTKGRTAPPPNLPPMRLDLAAVKEQYGDEALAAIPPEVRAYSAQATDADQFAEVARDVRKTLAKKRPKSLWKFLSTSRVIGSGNDKISYRGIRDDGGELIKIIGEKKAAPGLIADGEDAKKVRSYTIEHAAEAAWAEGYFNGPNPPTPAEFLDALRSDFDGQAKLYARADMADIQEIADAEAWSAWFDQNGIDINEKDPAVLKTQLEEALSSGAENAIGPDEAAAMLGGVLKTKALPDGNALLQALKAGPQRDKLIREETKRRMIEKHGDIFRNGTIAEEAKTYARNEIQLRQTEIELEALAKAAGQFAANNLAKQQAIENLRTKQVREVLNYNQWLVLEQRWGKKALEAAEKGKFDDAARYKKFQLLNLHMYREGRKLAEKIETTRKTLVAYGTKPRQQRLFAAGKEYAENMNSLLDDYQLRNETKAGENKRLERAAWIKAQMAAIDPFAAYQDTTKSAQEQQVEAAEAIERSRALANEQPSEAKGFKSLTVQEFMALEDEAAMIWKMATLADQLLNEGKRRRLTLAAEDIAAEIIANQPKEKPPEPIETDAPGEKVKRGVLKYFAMHRTMQSLAHQFAGGKDGGQFWSYFIKPLNAAYANLSTLRKQMGEDLTKLFGAYTKQEIARFYKDRRTFNLSSGKVSLTTQGRLAVALNAGNEKNRQRLMDSMGWTLADVQTILDTLEKRDWDFVQKTWDYLNTWFPEANRVHEAVHGVPMDKVEPLQVATRFGVYAGGYYPIAFDPELSSKSAQRKTEADAKSISGRVDARSAPSFSKKRVEGKVTLPLKLSVFDVITRHLDQVATSIATEEALFDAGRLIRRPEVEEAIVQHHGRQIYNTIVNTLVTTKFGMEGTSGILAHLRNGATVVGLGWKVATALLQPLGVSNSVVRVGGYWVAKGYARMGRDAATIQSSAKWVMDRSEFMRHRRQSQSPELAALKDSIKKGGITPRWLTQSMFALMSNTQFYSVDLPTWYAGWYKAKAAGLDEVEAAAQGDQAVIDAQGGGELHQTAAIQTGAGTKYAAALRLLTNFMSYMVTTYNLATQRVRNANSIAKMAALTFDMVILLAIPVAGKMALDAWTKGGGDDDDEDLWEKFAREEAAFLLSPFVGISQVAGAVRGEDAFGYRGPAGLGIFAEATNAGKAAAEGKFFTEDGELDPAFWRPANKTAGMIFHYPASQLDLTVRGATALWKGETDNIATLFFGPPPAN